jgi:hypothetical protein
VWINIYPALAAGPSLLGALRSAAVHPPPRGNTDQRGSEDASDYGREGEDGRAWQILPAMSSNAYYTLVY